MVRDLVEIAVKMVREERELEVRERARQAAEERVLDLLLPPSPPSSFGETSTESQMAHDQANTTRERLREQLRAGRLDAKVVEIDVRERSMPSFEVIQGSSIEEIGVNIRDMMPGLFPGKTRRRHSVPAHWASHAGGSAADDMDTVSRAAIERVEQAGIIFVDEIDKIAGREGAKVRREPRACSATSADRRRHRQLETGW